MNIKNADELQNTREKLKILEDSLEELKSKPVTNPVTRELTRQSLRRFANQLIEEITRFECGVGVKR